MNRTSQHRRRNQDNDFSHVRSTFLYAMLGIGLGLVLSACGGTDSERSVDKQEISITTSSSAQNSVPNQFIVQTKPGADPAEVGRSIAATHGGEVTHVYEHALDGFAIRVPEAGAEAAGAGIQAHAQVSNMEQDGQAVGLGQSLPTGIDRSQVDKNPTANIDGSDERVDIDVAILDSGIDKDHEDLNVAGGVNFNDGGENEWGDGHGHGTHVAGTVGALDNDRGVVGVAPGAKVWGIRVLDDSGYGYWSEIIAGIDWVTQHSDKIEVANLSLGGQGKSSALRTALQNSIEAGVVYTVAAGNSTVDVYGSDGSQGTYDDFIPAAYPEVATISALKDTDGTPDSDSVAFFSNYAGSVVGSNPVDSPGGAIDLMLPGYSILSTRMGGGTQRMSGTSMAAPHAAGLAALQIARTETRDVNDDGNVDSADVYQLRQTLIDRGAAQDSADGLETLNDPDSNLEPIGQAKTSGDAAPNISWNNPTDGATVSGQVDIQLDVSDQEDDTNDLTVEYRVDGVYWRSADVDLGTSNWIDGSSHTLEARVTDSSGNTSTASIEVTAADEDAAPSMRWKNPMDGATVSGSVQINVYASDREDESGSLTVEWRVDGGQWRSANADGSSYFASWNTADWQNGTHTLEARATDSSGQSSSAAIEVTVDNTTSGYVENTDFSKNIRQGPFGRRIRDLTATVYARLDADEDETAEPEDEVWSGASIEVELTLDADGDGSFECGNDDPCKTFTGTTNRRGGMEFTVKDVPAGKYQTEVTSLTGGEDQEWEKTLDADNPDTVWIE